MKSEKPVSVKFTLDYLVKNAGWTPHYELKANSESSVVAMKYNAKIKQDTKADWKNVNLKLSNANPNNSLITPELVPYYIGQYSSPPVYEANLNSGELSGTVLDEEGLPIISAIILLRTAQ